MAAQHRIPNAVLYVEDEESDAYFMQVAFEEAGLGTALHRVGTGREAMHYLSGQGLFADRARHPVPRVLLLDLNLPVVSGFAVLEWVRGQAEFRTLPVVVFTSSTRAEDKQRALALGADDYAEKPSSGLEFNVVVQRLRERWLQA